MLCKKKYELDIATGAHNRYGRIAFFSGEEYKARLARLSERMEADAVDALVLPRRAACTNPDILWLTGKYESIEGSVFVVHDGKIRHIEDRPGGGLPEGVEPHAPGGPGGGKAGGPGGPGGDSKKQGEPAGVPKSSGVYGAAYSPFLQGELGDNVQNQLKGLHKIAFVGLGGVDMQLLDAVRKTAPEAQLVDYTDTLTALRAVKDEAELEAVTEGAYVQEKALEAISQLVEQGRPLRDIAADLNGIMRRYGAEFCGGTAPISPVVEIEWYPQADPLVQTEAEAPAEWPGPVITPGCMLRIRLTGGGAGCYCAVTGRNVYTSPPGDRARELWQLCVQTQAQIAALCRDGAGVREIRGLVEQRLREKDAVLANPEDFLCGLGVTWQESPCIWDNADTVLRTNMVLRISPEILLHGCREACANTYVVKDDGAVRIGRLKDEPIILQ